MEAKRQLVDPGHPSLSTQRQCELLGLARSSYYYQAKGEDPYNLLLMRLIDERYTKRPFFGILRMTDYLQRQGHEINHKRVERLMRLMGLEAIYPKPRTSRAQPEHRKYPYLLRGLVIDRPDQVWCSDVTYIRLVEGFVYLVAIMDWYSRYVLSWRLSNTLDASFCVEAARGGALGEEAGDLQLGSRRAVYQCGVHLLESPYWREQTSGFRWMVAVGASTILWSNAYGAA